MLDDDLLLGLNSHHRHLFSLHQNDTWTIRRILTKTTTEYPLLGAYTDFYTWTDKQTMNLRIRAVFALCTLFPSVLADPGLTRGHDVESGSGERSLVDSFDSLKSRNFFSSALRQRSQPNFESLEELASRGEAEEKRDLTEGAELVKRDNAVETNQNGSQYIWMLADTYAGESFYE